ncbi:MAG: AP-4-A phosphorylase [Alphaproteobacteria bacterium ADurb.Bin438]|nr:MAG: AP-4-A phosphorylase [Alphaproteobacteria bacterium ADurb.Bin438]
MDCYFCSLLDKPHFLENELCFAHIDNFPVTFGHTLIIPKRHFADFFEASDDEIKAIHELLKIRRQQLLDEDKSISGFNIGVNIGKSAGQSVFHLHVHLIPRRDGDCKNPKGGVRGVIPEKMSYTP